MLPLLAALSTAAAAAAGCSRGDWLLAADDGHARTTVAASGSPASSGSASALPAAGALPTITLGNGLIQRTFTTAPSFGTIDLQNLRTGDSALRHIVPEAALAINGTNYTLGGLYIVDEPSSTGAQFTGQHAFLNRTGLQARLRIQPNAWTYDSHWVGEPEADLPWTPGRRASPKYVSWPPTGKRLSVKFAPPVGSPPELNALNITLVYELYDGAEKAIFGGHFLIETDLFAKTGSGQTQGTLINQENTALFRAGAPMLSKWLEISTTAAGATPFLVDRVTTELLALNCDHSPTSHAGTSRLDVHLSAAHGAAAAWTTSANSTNDPGACEPILSASYSGPPPIETLPPDVHQHDNEHSRSLPPTVAGPAPPAPPAPPSPPVVVPAAGPSVFIGGSSAIAVSKFSSFRTILLLHDTLDATRQMLGRHQIYRRLAPWIQENPLQLHLTNDTTAAFDIALEQMHEVRIHAPLRACARACVCDRNVSHPVCLSVCLHQRCS
jgi:hypothetical protein